MGIRKLCSVFGCTMAVVMGVMPQVALATPSDDLQALYADAEVTNEEINRLTSELDNLDASIAEHEMNISEKTSELKTMRNNLSALISEEYKDGDVGLIDILLNSDSLSEAISRIQAFDAVNNYRCATIGDINRVSAELVSEKADLEQDKSTVEDDLLDMKASKADLDAKIAEAEAYKASLPQDVLASVAQQIVEDQNLDAAVMTEVMNILSSEETLSQIVAPEASSDNVGNVIESVPVETVQVNNDESSGVSVDEVQVTQTESSPEVSQTAQEIVSAVTANPGAANSDYAQKVVEAALSQVGNAYVWGTSEPGVSFDCSGLTMYAYGTAGYDISHYSEDQSQYCTKPVSEAEVGDILWKPGHVGIYIGNGQTVEAFNPERGVGIGTADRFVAAGSPANFG